MEPSEAVSSDLDGFIEFLFEGLEGYAYLAAKNPNDKDDWKQEFFAYPEQASQLKEIILAASKSLEVYIAPAIYSEKIARRESFKASNVVWTEFDGNAPEWEDVHGDPSLIIQSSSEDNQHCYWKLNEAITDVNALESVNRNITYNMGADTSAWDATQVLRPPHTYNHKRKTTVVLKSDRNITYDLSVFDNLTPAPTAVSTSDWKISALPDVQDVILRYAFPPDIIALLKKEKDDVSKGNGQRARSLVNLAMGACQLGLKDSEVFVLLLLADDRWEKFKGRRDREKRLAHIITVARNKYPSDEEHDENPVIVYGFQSLLNTEISIEWAIEGMIMEKGFMLLVGPSGVGKTTLSIQFMIHLALGKDYFHYKIEKPKKVGFLSLEMGHEEVKIFLEAIAKDLDVSERALLEENFLIIPYGEAWPLNQPTGQQSAEWFISTYNLEAFFVDSIGSAILGNISSDEVIQPLINWNDKMRNKYNCLTWYIHHMRKQTPGQAINQDDVYGNQFLFNRATSSYGVLWGKDGTIKIRNLKQRLAPKEKDYFIKRTENSNFEKTTKPVDNLVKKVTSIEGKPTAGGFSL